MTATSGAMAAPQNGAHLQAQRDAAAAARRSAAQLRRIAMRLVVRLTIFDGVGVGGPFSRASMSLLHARSVGVGHYSKLLQRDTGISQIERAECNPG
jgi:hypothetical protein